MNVIKNCEDCVIKNFFHKNKEPISIDKAEIKRIVLSKIHWYDIKGSFKYFKGHIHKSRVFLSPLCIKLPQMNAYVKYFDNNNKYVNF